MHYDEEMSQHFCYIQDTIQKNINEISRGRTTLIIAHRLSTIVDADTIFVLEGGKVVEQGPHDELVDRGGVYATMWNRQQQDDH